MSGPKTTNVSHVKFASAVFPTEEDMRLWHGLSAEDQRAVVRRDLDEAEASGRRVSMGWNTAIGTSVPLRYRRLLARAAVAVDPLFRRHAL